MPLLNPTGGPASAADAGTEFSPSSVSHPCIVNANPADVLPAPDAEIELALHHLPVENGRVTGVTYIKGGQEFFQPADVVLLAGYVYENVRLLLLSKSNAYPDGLSNKHGQVGRHYFSHNQGASVSALFPFALNNWYGAPAQGVSVDNWADDNFDHSALDFIGGGNMWVYTERRPIASVNALATWSTGNPAWGSKWMKQAQLGYLFGAMVPHPVKVV